MATRTDAQNRYYHAAVVRPVADAMNVKHDAAHEWLKRRHLGERADPATGEVVPASSTAELSVGEFSAYVERCRDWASRVLRVAFDDGGEQAA